MIVTERVKIISYYTHNCKYKGCIHNLLGQCLCSSPDLTKEINEMLHERLDGLDIHKDADKILENLNEEFTCDNAQAEEGRCINCGKELLVYNEDYEYMGNIVLEPRLGCPNCD